jgi:hypothetical protein
LVQNVLFSEEHNSSNLFWNIYLIGQRYISDSIFTWGGIAVLLFILLVTVWIIRHNKFRSQLLFLLIWLGTGFIPYLKSTDSIPLYYYSGGAAISLIVLSSFFLQLFFKQAKYEILAIIGLIVISNLYLISTYNGLGTLPSINVQSGMLWSDQKKAVDFIYQDAHGGQISVNALSVPLNVNMVWSYVFEEYGQKKYGYLPIWGGDAAAGYAGHLRVEKVRSNLPDKQYLIVEPPIGIEQYMVNDFVNQENLFTKVVDEKSFGLIKVQIRQKI